MGIGKERKKGNILQERASSPNHVLIKSLKRVDCTIAGYYNKISERI